MSTTTLTRLTEWTPANRILCECTPGFDPDRRFDWCGAVRDDGYRVLNDSLESERRAARELAREKPSVRGLVMALHHLDMDAGREISDYSHAAAATDRTRITVEQDAGRTIPQGAGDRAIRIAVEREATAIAQMTTDSQCGSRWGNLRRRIVRLLLAAGVVLHDTTSDPDNPCLYCVRSHATAYRSWDTLRHYPEYPEHDRLREEMQAMGLRAN